MVSWHIIVLGFVIGMLSGMFGFGGSSISTPMLRIFLSVSPYYALASPLPISMVSSCIALIRYYKENLIDWSITKEVLLFLIPGSIAGAYITRFIGGEYLMLLTGVFLIYISLRLLFKKEQKILSKIGLAKLRLIWFFVGFVSGMLANAGGILISPLLVFLGVKIKRAIATSLSIALVGSIPVIVVHGSLNHIDWMLTLLLSLGVIPASYIGASITVRMDRRKLKTLYGLFLLLFSVYFIVFELIKVFK